VRVVGEHLQQMGVVVAQGQRRNLRVHVQHDVAVDVSQVVADGAIVIGEQLN
jgi:hypothetical protein